VEENELNKLDFGYKLRLELRKIVEGQPFAQ